MPVKACNKRCSGCALTAGSEANQEVKSRLVAKLAVLGPFPFYCHATFDWQNESSGKKTRAEFQEKQFGLCSGWMEEVRELAATGYYKEASMPTKVFALVAKDTLEEFIVEEDAEEKKLLAKKLEDLLLRLADKRKRYQSNVVNPI
jgi:hypothetical protein